MQSQARILGSSKYLITQQQINGMIKLQDSVKFVDDMGKSFNGIVIGINSNKTVDIRVRRKIGFEPQIFLKVPTPNKKKTNKPYYIEPSVKKETPKKKE